MSVRDLDTYEVIKEEDLTGIQSKGTLLRHKKSGARVLLVENEDNNKVFSIGFRTPPADSTGVPHIMEHSVLCGSRNFPPHSRLYQNTYKYPDISHIPPVLFHIQ